MNKAIFLDRDGTINVEKDYLYQTSDFEFLPGVIDGLKLLQDDSFLLIIITNQSGIARGFYTEKDFQDLNDWMIATLKAQGVYIDAVYYCPHHPAAKVRKYQINCNCRKPNTGLFERAIKDYNIDVSKSYSIGDKLRDCKMCESAGAHGYLIASNEKPELIELVKRGEVKNVRYANSLLEAAQEILKIGI